MKSSMKRLVICGTGTEVGKTIVSALLVQGLKAQYWKPVQTGSNSEVDRETICRLLDLPTTRCLPETYIFKAPVSPQWAAEQENSVIKPENLTLPIIKSPLVIETAGGLMVPFTRDWLQIDQLEKWQLPIVLVAKSGLGTLNHTLLSLEALQLRKISVLGLVLNGPLHPDNPTTLEQFGGVPVIAQLPFLDSLNADSLRREWERQKIEDSFKKLLG